MVNNCIDPDSSYSSGSTYAQKPDISAPGWVIFNDGYHDAGTSFSAPFVSGIIAIMMSANASYRENPTAVKAALTAAVSNTTNHQYTPISSNYMWFGAGIADAQRPAIDADFQSGIIYWDDPYIEYQIHLVANKRTRISLAYQIKSVLNANGTVTASSIPDLDIEIYMDGVDEWVDVSLTNNNNVEIVDFYPPSTYSYWIRIYNRSTNSTNTFGTEFSVSWIQE